MLVRPPAAIALTSPSPLTLTGTSLSTVVALPSSPSSFSPHASTLPTLAARLCASPAATALASVRPTTATGLVLHADENFLFSGSANSSMMHACGPVEVPSPSCPLLLNPHAFTPPVPSSARLCAKPAEIAVTPVRPVTATGAVLQGCWILLNRQCSGPVDVPLPSCPTSFDPHALTVPLLSSARLKPPPAAIATTSLRPLTGTGMSL